jgi:hypothetical protein
MSGSLRHSQPYTQSDFCTPVTKADMQVNAVTIAFLNIKLIDLI